MRMTTRTALAVSALGLLLACSACRKPEPPEKEQPPEPQAQATQLRDAIQAPIERAKAVEPAVLDAAQQQRDAIDAQTGG
jgi:flagellar basal body L-ring protein FlgH